MRLALSDRQIREWKAFYMNDPRAIEDDARAGVVASVVASAMGAKKKSGELLSAGDIFPRVRAEKPKQGWRAAKARLAGYFAGVNAYAESKGATRGR